uniref:Protein lin-14 n=1 Tax=Ascaris suum TaxID=6253 RepID=F1KY32_ASCSU
MYQVCTANGNEPPTTALSGAGASLPRKRVAAPECPVAVRPMPTCAVPSPFVHWNPWLFSSVVQPTSPTIPQLTLPDALQVDSSKRWSSPSSVESSQKADSSNGESSHVDPVGLEGSESSSISSAASTRIMIASPEQTTPATVTSKIDPLAALNPLFFHQHIVQQLVTNGQGAQNTQPLRQLHEFAQQQQPHRQHSQLQQQQQQPPANNVDKTVPTAFTPNLEAMASRQNQLAQQQLVQQLLSNSQNVQTSLLQQQQQQTLAAVSTERKKPVSDDYVKLIRQKGINKGSISSIKIPVPQAYSCDPDFVPASEEQIVQQFHQNRRCDDDVRKAMTLLSKMLAEKRVFGTKLMAQTTVAGPNHSTYKNLPEEGIHYIAYVCRSVMLHRIPNEDEFWEVFRDVTRKLAARCRRVRHSKKTRCEGREALRINDCVSERGSVSTDSLRSVEAPHMGASLKSSISVAAP